MLFDSSFIKQIGRLISNGKQLLPRLRRYWKRLGVFWVLFWAGVLCSNGLGPQQSARQEVVQTKWTATQEGICLGLSEFYNPHMFSVYTS